ncbi:MAG: hypothetical protein GY794_07025 [bacterium]|nr:hypothetical protein [bacterium]
MIRPGIFSAAASQFQANLAQADAQSASRAAADARSQAMLLELDIEKLFMITEAMWNILKEKHGYSDDDFLRMVQDIDLRDGQLDGKVAKQANPPCSQCGRILSSKHPMCMYCGAVSTRAPFER